MGWLEKKELEKRLGGYVKSKLSDYYFIPIDQCMDIDKNTGGLFIQPDGKDYYKLTMQMDAKRFTRDESRLKGLQARLLAALFNTASGGGFDNYPPDTTVCVNNNFGYSSQLKDIFNLVPYLDNTTSKTIRITSAVIPNGIARFIAMLGAKDAVLTIYGGLSDDEIEGFLKPYFKIDTLDTMGLLREYIRDDYDLNHKP